MAYFKRAEFWHRTGMNGEVRVEMMRKRDPVRFGDQTQQCAVPVERPVPTARLDAQAGFVIAIERGLRNTAARLPIDQVDRLIADPVDRDDLNRMAGNDSSDHGTGLDILKKGHRWTSEDAAHSKDGGHWLSLRQHLTLIAKSSKHENAKQPHWAQARSSCWGTRSPPL